MLMLDTDGKCACKGSTLMRFTQPIILCLLTEGSAHGYNLLDRIGATKIWQGASPDATGVYRTLNDMESRGLVVSRIEFESKAAIGKRVYSITDSGRMCMRNWIQTLTQYTEGVFDLISRLENASQPAEQPPSGPPAE